MGGSSLPSGTAIRSGVKRVASVFLAWLQLHLGLHLDLRHSSDQLPLVQLPLEQSAVCAGCEDSSTRHNTDGGVSPRRPRS